MEKFLKIVLFVIVVAVLLSIAWALLKFAIKVLLPIAIIIIAAYIVYTMFIRKTY